MWHQWLRFEFRMELDSDKPRMFGNFDDLNQIALFANTRKRESMLFEQRTIFVVEFISMAMTFMNQRLAVSLGHPARFDELTRIRTKAHRTAHVFHLFLLFH